jgi:hypothetical protein
MKRATVATLVALGLWVWAAAAQQPAQKKAAMPVSKATNPAFEQLKSLAGEWEGTFQGQKGTTSYRVVAAGSAIENRLFEGKAEEMVTMFHLDGPVVMVTHYCAAGNQPRMVAQPSTDPKVIHFTFKDVTNLAAPSAEHMRELTITFVDANHHKQAWTSRGDGKEHTEVFEFTRKK